MVIKSAGVLLYRQTPKIEVLLGHMGGPFWEHKDEGAWGIPKGLVDEGETLIDAAVRECYEEVGFEVDPKGLRELGIVKMKNGKEVHAWAYEVEPGTEIAVSSNTFDLEWPKGSGEIRQFPEVDRASWFDLEQAAKMIIEIQSVFLRRLENL
jgi:predicted NUDIX family NTP pyrophosphohydrolase